MVTRVTGYADLFLERTDQATVRLDESEDATWIGSSEGAAARWLGENATHQASTTGLGEDRLRRLSRGPAPEAPGDRETNRSHRSAPNRARESAEGLRRYLFKVREAALALSVDGASLLARGEVRLQQIAVATSEGEVREDQREWISFTAKLTAQGRDRGRPARVVTEGGGAVDLERLYRIHPPEKIARAMARSLDELEDAGPAPSGKTTVVLAPGAGGIFFHESCGHALEGDSALRGGSALVELLGEQIGSEGLTLVDDPTVPGLAGSYCVDDEGWPAGSNVLIESGRLVGLLLDRATARQAGMAPTGNARRESYRDMPIPRMTNTYVREGITAPAEILSSVGRGIYVAELGTGEVDTATGDFSFRIRRGYSIADGRMVAPIRPALITGNGLSALRQITMLGNDLKFDPGAGECGKMGQRARAAVGQPTIRVDGLTVRPEEGQ